MFRSPFGFFDYMIKRKSYISILKASIQIQELLEAEKLLLATIVIMLGYT